MTRNCRSWACLLALCLLPGTLWAGPKAESKHDPKADFSRYHTYVWQLQEERFPPAGTPGDLVIRGSVDRELAAKGLRRVEEGEAADLRITYYAVMEDKLDIEGVDYELNDWLHWSDTGGQSLRSYQKGTLVIDLVDNASNELVWSGWISDVASTREKLRAKVPKAVRRVLKLYPPKP